MPNRLLLRDDMVRRIESELAALDHFLKRGLDPQATVATHRDGAPERRVELRRTDGAVVGITITPFLLDPDDDVKLEYIVAPFARAQENGKHRDWRHTRDWTVCLATPRDVLAAEPLIADAWRLAMRIDRSEILKSK